MRNHDIPHQVSRSNRLAQRVAREPRRPVHQAGSLHTGLRRGEMIGLRREDVALLERVLYVKRSIGAYDDP
jgi:integrase